MLVGTRNGRPRTPQEMPPPVTPPLPLVPGTIPLQRCNPLRIRLHQPIPRHLIALCLPNQRTPCPRDLQPTITRPEVKLPPTTSCFRKPYRCHRPVHDCTVA